jgi:hypothetical protein
MEAVDDRGVVTVARRRRGVVDSLLHQVPDEADRGRREIAPRCQDVQERPGSLAVGALLLLDGLRRLQAILGNELSLAVDLEQHPVVHRPCHLPMPTLDADNRTRRVAFESGSSLR